MVVAHHDLGPRYRNHTRTYLLTRPTFVTHDLSNRIPSWGPPRHLFPVLTRPAKWMGAPRGFDVVESGGACGNILWPPSKIGILQGDR
jgi:hypothetical protein